MQLHFLELVARHDARLNILQNNLLFSLAENSPVNDNLNVNKISCQNMFDFNPFRPYNVK